MIIAWTSTVTPHWIWCLKPKNPVSLDQINCFSHTVTSRANPRTSAIFVSFNDCRTEFTQFLVKFYCSFSKVTRQVDNRFTSDVSKQNIVFSTRTWKMFSSEPRCEYIPSFPSIPFSSLLFHSSLFFSEFPFHCSSWTVPPISFYFYSSVRKSHHFLKAKLPALARHSMKIK